MANKKDITDTELRKYRQLLDLYYDGLTSKEQERQLFSLANKCDIDSMPEELKADTLMIRDLSSMSKDAVRFEKALHTITPDDARKPGSRNPWKWALAITSVAAAAVLCIVLFQRKPVPETDHHGATINTATAHSAQTNVPTPTVAEVSVIEETPVPTKQNNTKPSKKSIAATEAPQPVKSTREIDNPEEATEIIRQSLSLLALNLNKSNASLKESAEILTGTLQDTENKLNNLL